MPNNNFNIKSKKNIPTSPVLQNIDSNLSSVENPLFPDRKLSVGALQEINQLKTPTSPVLQNIGSPNTSQFISKPEIPSQEEQDNSRFLASLLGQGVAMFGAGIAGRDPMRAGEIISDQRAYQERLNQQQKIQKEQKDLADNLMNPESKQSIRKRLLYSRALGVNIPNDISASDLEDPVVLNSLKQQSIQAQMAKMPKQLGVTQPKEEKRKEPTEAERLSLGFAKRTENSDKMLSSLENNFIEGKDGFSPSQQFAYAPERFKSSNRKNYEAAQIDFIGAVLRKESGAAISDEEFERESKKYFPLPGDSPENIAYKQALRKQAINNLKTSANVKYVRDNQTGETIEIDPFGNILKRYK